MKQTQKLLSQYKSDIDRLLLNEGKNCHIGYTYTKGKSPAIYMARNSDGLIITSRSYNTGKELLIAMTAVHYWLQIK